MRRGTRAGRRAVVTTTAAVVITVAFMLPMVWLIGSAFRPRADIFAHLSPLTLEAFIPTRVTLDNFRALFDRSFGLAVFNSVFVATLSVGLGLVVNSFAAFALSAIDFPGRRYVFVAVVVSFLVPFESIAIPLSNTVRSMGFDNGYPALIAPGVANGFAIFLLRQFFLGIPVELKEAARLDGASLWHIYRHIYLPLSKAPMIGAGIIIFIFQWQAYLWPLLVINDPRLEVAPVALAKLIGQFNFDAGQMFAGAIILALIPALIILPLQRYFTESVAHTGIK
jgi:multiple sugar transport system permease protein/putative chitobiose transport system permease protein